MEDNEQKRTPNEARRTGLAIAVAFLMVFAFYIVYEFFFRTVVEMYARYDSSFASGFGALILLVIAPNILSLFSAAIVSLRIFPLANKVGLFYGLAALFSLLCIVSILIEVFRSDRSYIAIASQTLIWFAATYLLRIVLLGFEGGRVRAV